MTQLCAIPGCRIRNRHQPTCPGDCHGCLPRTATDGHACDIHVTWADSDLHAITELADDAEAVARGEVRRGTGRASGKPGSRTPGNDGAREVLDALANALTTMARDIAETRGLRFP